MSEWPYLLNSGNSINIIKRPEVSCHCRSMGIIITNDKKTDVGVVFSDTSFANPLVDCYVLTNQDIEEIRVHLTAMEWSKIAVDRILPRLNYFKK